MRSGYYDGELDQYTFHDSGIVLYPSNYVYILQRDSELGIYSLYTSGRRSYKLEITIRQNNNNAIVIYCWNQSIGDPVRYIITKLGYYNFLYSNIERIISDGSELELGKFIHTEFVKLVEYYSEHGDTLNYVFGQPPTKK
jgi:hypothetical protein